MSTDPTPDWRRVRFGEVVSLNTERCAYPAVEGIDRYIGLEHLEPGDLRVRSWGLVSDGTTFTNRVRPGQVLFGKRRAYQRKVAVSDFDAICSSDIYSFESRDAAILLPELLPYLCQTERFFEFAVGTSAGSLSPRTNWKHLAEYEFDLPPLDEQRRIAEVLAQSTSMCEHLSEAIQNLEILKTSHVEATYAVIDEQTVSLGSVAIMQNGRGFPGDQYQDEGVRLLRPGNLGSDGYVTWEPSKTVCLPQEFATEAQQFMLTPGDVVMNLTAQSLEDGFMGRACLLTDTDASLLNQRIGRFRFSEDALPEYVYRVFQTERFLRHAIAQSEGTKIRHLYWRHLEPFRFALPSISEQRKAIEQTREIDASIVALLDRLSMSKSMHSNFLLSLF